MDPLSFICTQPYTETNSVQALRMITNNTKRVTLELHEEPITLWLREDPVDAAVGVMLKYGMRFGKAETAFDVLRTCSDIARCTRRGAGNTTIVHFDDAERFKQFWDIADIVNVNIHTVATPQLRGKLIVSYKSRVSEADGAPIMVQHNNECGFSLVGIQNYVRVLDF